MTYEERKKWLCEQCNHKNECAYVRRNLEYKCLLLEERMEGWELGWEDAIDKVHKWINEKWDVAYTHPLVMDAVHKEIDEFMEEQQ